MTRLFVAAWPDDATRHHLRQLPLTDWSPIRPVPERNWHITLEFLGDADEDVIAAALDHGVFPRVTAEVGSEIAVLGSNSLVVTTHGVEPLVRAVRAATRHSTRHSDFFGHLTLARFARTQPPQRRPGAGEPRQTSSAFTVESIALVASALTDQGAEYTTLASWPTVSVGER